MTTKTMHWAHGFNAPATRYRSSVGVRLGVTMHLQPPQLSSNAGHIGLRHGMGPACGTARDGAPKRQEVPHPVDGVSMHFLHNFRWFPWLALSGSLWPPPRVGILLVRDRRAAAPLPTPPAAARCRSDPAPRGSDARFLAATAARAAPAGEVGLPATPDPGPATNPAAAAPGCSIHADFGKVERGRWGLLPAPPGAVLMPLGWRGGQAAGGGGANAGL